MKHLIRFSSILVAGLILFCAASALADSDPKIIIGDPSCDGCTSISGTSFSFTLPTDQGAFFNGPLQFENDSGQTWYSLFLTEDIIPWFNVQCQVNAFFNFCQSVPSNPTDPNQTTVEFLNTLPNPGTGIPNGGVFTLDFEAVNGNSWPSGTNFDGQATTAVPEPGSAVLLLAEVFLFLGICAVVRRKSSWKSWAMSLAAR